MPDLKHEISQIIRDIPDFPKQGVIFKDITPLLRHPEAFKKVIDWMIEPHLNEGIDIIVGVESRGFMFASPAAYKLGAGVVPVRKPGKLPWKTLEASYQLEYGVDRLQIHQDAITPGQKVLILDDVLATGGTAEATSSLVKKLGGEIVEACFLIELSFLKGRDKLPGIPVRSLLQF